MILKKTATAVSSVCANKKVLENKNRNRLTRQIYLTYLDGRYAVKGIGNNFVSRKYSHKLPYTHHHAKVEAFMVVVKFKCVIQVGQVKTSAGSAFSKNNKFAIVEISFGFFH